MAQIIVGKYKEGQVHTLQEAFDLANSMEGHVEIYVKPGIYDEKAILTRNHVSIIGEDMLTTVITNADYARKIHADGNRFGTFRTATLKIEADDVTVQNLTVINRSGNGCEVGQAVAMHTKGDCICFYHCRMLGAQDTLYLEPQPECDKDHEDDLPEEYNVCVARVYLKDCYIRGDIDFIFGGATAYFKKCDIFSQYNMTEEDDKFEGRIKGYATAACTFRGQKFGFVFDECRFLSDCPQNTVYLGRPWRMYAKTVLLHCEVGAHIKAEGWHDWDKEKAHKNSFYAEYDCTYLGDNDFSKRPDWIHTLSDIEAMEYTPSKVLWEGLTE